MERHIKAAIFPGTLHEFVILLPSLLRSIRLPVKDDPDIPFIKKYEIQNVPRDYITNFLPLLDVNDIQKTTVLAALDNLYGMDPDRDFEIFARNALPILKWIRAKQEVLRELIQLPSSGNPYIFRHLWVYTLVSREDGERRAGIEAFSLSEPLGYTMVQFTDGYDPFDHWFFEPLGDDFRVIADSIVAGSKSRAVIENTHQKSAKKSGNNLRKGGRPRNKDDDWAFEQVRVLGKTPSEIYPEWSKKIGDRVKTLADPYDSFKKAISPQRGKKRGEERE